MSKYKCVAYQSPRYQSQLDLKDNTIKAMNKQLADSSKHYNDLNKESSEKVSEDMNKYLRKLTQYIIHYANLIRLCLYKLQEALI